VLMGLLEKDPARRMDVQTARTILRQQLAGPLASTSPPHMMTDPYSVVPAQRPPAAPAETQPIPPQPSGQIGGRAMLAPGASLTDHLAKLQQSNAPAAGGRRRAPEPGDTLMPGAATGFLPAAQHPDPTSVIPPREAWNGARAAGEPIGGTIVRSPSAKRKAMIDNAVGSAKAATGKAVETFKGWPRNKQLIAGGGALALVIVLVLVISLSGGGSTPTTPVAQPGSSQAAAPDFETQDYQGNDKVTVKVPAGWKRAASGNYVDYVDPNDKQQKVRVLVEPGSIKPQRFVSETAPGTLKKSKNCPTPFKQLGTTDVQVSGQPGAQFEYTCGAGDAMRHGIWRMTTVGGSMYSFYLTTSDASFADSKKFFDAMADSFKINV
jgi:hypothetical protein